MINHTIQQMIKPLFFLLVTLPLLAQKKMKPELTELWEPVPEVIQPRESNNPPSDAIVLFDGTDLSKWINSSTGQPADWIINPDGSMTVKRDGGIETSEEFVHFCKIVVYTCNLNH